MADDAHHGDPGRGNSPKNENRNIVKKSMPSCSGYIGLSGNVQHYVVLDIMTSYASPKHDLISRGVTL